MTGKDVDHLRLLRRVQVTSLVLTALFVLAGLLWHDSAFALSILAGAVLANGSFWLLKRDARQILDRIAASAPESVRTVQRLERIRFIFKFYAKLIVLGLLLYVLSTWMVLDMIGVAVGLSTVMLSVIGVALGGYRKMAAGHGACNHSS